MSCACASADGDGDAPAVTLAVAVGVPLTDALGDPVAVTLRVAEDAVGVADGEALTEPEADSVDGAAGDAATDADAAGAAGDAAAGTDVAADALGDPADRVAEHELDCVDVMLLVAVNVAVMLLDGEADGDSETLGVAVARAPGSAQHSARAAHAARRSHRLRAIMWTALRRRSVARLARARAAVAVLSYRAGACCCERAPTCAASPRPLHTAVADVGERERPS
jgi:hypothetical protein